MNENGMRYYPKIWQIQWEFNGLAIDGEFWFQLELKFDYDESHSKILLGLGCARHRIEELMNLGTFFNLILVSKLGAFVRQTFLRGWGSKYC